MAELKTKKNEASVEHFLHSIADEQRRNDCLAVADLMKKATKAEPSMWGENIVGFGRYRYSYASGRQGEWFITGFSPRKQNLTLYLISGFAKHAELLQKLGKHKVGKSCLYINRLQDIHLPTLKELIKESVAVAKANQ